MSFRARLVLAAAYLLATVVIALTVPLALNIDRRATSELESDVVANATVLSGRVANLVRSRGRPTASRRCWRTPRSGTAPARWS